MTRNIIFIFTLISTLFLVVACSSDNSAAVSTAVAGTMESQVVETAVAATQEAAVTPTPPPELLCIDQAEDFLDETEEILERWFDALTIADSTPRMSLAGPIAELQAIRREYNNLDYPTCARRARNSVVSHMDHSIEGMLNFMRDDPYESDFDQAGDALEDYLTAMGEFMAEAVEATREARETLTPSP